MDIVVLGSSGGAPTKNRNCTAFLLREEGYSILFDCAEGTQRQMLKAGDRLSKIRYIFISHFHSDHIAGLIPLLSTKSMFNIPGEITLIGPKGLSDFIEFNLNFTQSRLGYEYKVIEASDGETIKFNEFSVTPYMLNHRQACYAYRVKFPDKPGNLIMEKLAKYGLSEGPVCGQLQKGEAVMTPVGQEITIKDVATEPKIGKTFSFISDTYLCKGMYKAAKNADVIYIEATFQKDDKDRAEARYHLTSEMCGKVAGKSNVKNMIMSHFSASYTNLNLFKKEAAENFDGKIYLARDLDVYKF